MPRYVIERFFDRITDDDMLAATVRSDRIALERFPEIWSAPAPDENGRGRCLAPATSLLG